MADIYSTRFYVKQGLSGSSPPIVVPGGRVYIVKQLTIYASPLLGLTTIFFHDLGSGAALWAQDANISSPVSGTFFGSFVFTEGQSFGFTVNSSFGESADVYAGGYDLTTP